MHPVPRVLRKYSVTARCLICSPWSTLSLVPAIPSRANCSPLASTQHFRNRITPAERYEREVTESRRRLRWSLVFLSLSVTAHLGHHAHHILPSFTPLGGGIGRALQVLPTGWVDWLQAGVATVALAGPGRIQNEAQYQFLLLLWTVGEGQRETSVHFSCVVICDGEHRGAFDRLGVAVCTEGIALSTDGILFHSLCCFFLCFSSCVDDGSSRIEVSRISCAAYVDLL